MRALSVRVRMWNHGHEHGPEQDIVLSSMLLCFSSFFCDRRMKQASVLVPLRARSIQGSCGPSAGHGVYPLPPSSAVEVVVVYGLTPVLSVCLSTCRCLSGVSPPPSPVRPCLSLAPRYCCR